ncbi:3-keto-disaccharide hydrolase [Lignipirellula cremea]|uniref:3-keto-alpha-glucoside-1,2-lyase/3-keto-2-hydroxy-glucal hydratase domain-containing protein n=1 Tax=Lignipirellula cremea TaxID=2528010 RepID=A0A518DKE3_9BACT|nr:DUF1080 domain-containing protein [Lignipirellula cremea]QDU92299.1 hypothetical protein Pla8534_00440 [Lignipirellula cremea]
MYRRAIFCVTLAILMVPADFSSAQVNDTALSEAENVPPKGFRALFNGRDLKGWKSRGDASEHYSVQDGVLAYDGQGSSLMTVDEFDNFILFVDWKAGDKGNSGVFLRGGATQVELNNADGPPRTIWNGTTGGLYPDKPPLKRAARPAGEWNRLEIRVENGVISVFTNQEKTIDRFAKEWGKRTQGPIGFQHHGTPFWIKKVFIQPLTTP